MRPARRKKTNRQSATGQDSRASEPGEGAAGHAADTVAQVPWGVLIFALALVVRLVYLLESTSNPTFNEPIMDASDYDDLARCILDGQTPHTPLFWQPVYYPLFLACVYRVTGASIFAAKLLQIIVGSVTCVLTYRFAARVFDRRTGVLAGILTCLCGPLIFYEAELLATGWAAFWSVVLVALLVRVAEARRWPIAVALGACGGLSVICRPTFLPVFVVGCVWTVVAGVRVRQPVLAVAWKSIAVVAGFVAVALPVSVWNLRSTDHFGMLPSTGGINLYIGNNPNAEETILYRPGREWRALMALPKEHGYTDGMWDEQRYFYGRARQYMREAPAEFLAGLAVKGIQFFSARELPRSVDIYSFRPWSWLLNGLVWKVDHHFGFPFGVLMPLAVVGLVHHARRVPAPIWLLLLLYPLAVILVFPAARYRVPLLPVFCMMASAGCFALVSVARAAAWRRWWAYAVGVLVTMLLISVPGPFRAEQDNYAAELRQFLGNRLFEEKRFDDAVVAYRDALAYAPEDPDVHGKLAEALAALGQVDGAIHHYKRSLAGRPDSATNHACLGTLYAQKGEFSQAIEHYREALRIDPDYAKVYSNLGVALQSSGQLDAAIGAYRTALRRDPDEPVVHYNLGAALDARGDLDGAIASFRRALTLDPDNVEALFGLGRALAKQGRHAEAEVALRKVLQLRPGHADAQRLLRRIEGR